MRTLSCGTRDLVPRPGIKPGPPALGVWSLTALDHQGSTHCMNFKAKTPVLTCLVHFQPHPFMWGKGVRDGISFFIKDGLGTMCEAGRGFNITVRPGSSQWPLLWRIRFKLRSPRFLPDLGTGGMKSRYIQSHLYTTRPGVSVTEVPLFTALPPAPCPLDIPVRQAHAT